MLEKYKELLKMLSKKYNVSSFTTLETEYNAIVEKIGNKNYIDLYLENNGIEVTLYNNETEEPLEVKKYKSLKYAYNFIIKNLED